MDPKWPLNPAQRPRFVASKTANVTAHWPVITACWPVLTALWSGLFGVDLGPEPNANEPQRGCLGLACGLGYGSLARPICTGPMALCTGLGQFSTGKPPETAIIHGKSPEMAPISRKFTEKRPKKPDFGPFSAKIP